MKTFLILFLACLTTTARSEGLHYTIGHRFHGLDFILHGTLTVVYFTDSNSGSVGKSLLYTIDGKQHILDGTPAAINFVLNTELSDGIGEDFLREKLPFALLAISNSSHYYVVTDLMVEKVREYCDQNPGDKTGQLFYKALRTPSVELSSETWKISIMYVSDDGTLYMSIFDGVRTKFAMLKATVENKMMRIPQSLLADY
jgi:hypothetical protein